MLQYICVITNEFDRISDGFVHSLSFHSSFSDATDFANDFIRNLNGESDYFIYRNIGLVEDDFLNQHFDDTLPF